MVSEWFPNNEKETKFRHDMAGDEKCPETGQGGAGGHDDETSGETRSHEFGIGTGDDLSRQNVACPVIFGVSARRVCAVSETA